MNSSMSSMNSYANPAPLGLCGFGITTILLNLHNAGFYELNTVIMAMGICYGGMAQIIAGLMEFRRGIPLARWHSPLMVCSGGHWF